MKIKLFKKEEAVARKISDSYSVYNFLTLKDSEKVSVAVGNADNHNEITTTSSDRAYFILEGNIIINDKIIGNVGDVIFVSANTRYNLSGSFKAVIVNSPPFKKSNS